jgi:hypothetical protein
MLLARQHGLALSDYRLEAPVDVMVTSPSAAAPADDAAPEPGKKNAEA